MRTLCWFSCGAASACAARLTLENEPNAEVLYCDTLAYEHPDNERFLKDCEEWLGVPIRLLRSSTYTDIYDVFRRTRWLVGVKGARCTTELKRNVRMAYQQDGDVQIFGLTADEQHRVARFERENPHVTARFPLIEAGLHKRHCLKMIADAGIAIPAMYELGYRNNNCVGCVKGQAGYWNKIRVDFPDAFNRMAKMERELDAAICKTEKNGERTRIFLDELPPDQGHYETEPDISCGVLCTNQARAYQLDLLDSSREVPDGEDKMTTLRIGVPWCSREGQVKRWRSH